MIIEPCSAGRFGIRISQRGPWTFSRSSDVIHLLQPPLHRLGFPISKQVSTKLSANCRIHHSKQGSGHFCRVLKPRSGPSPAHAGTVRLGIRAPAPIRKHTHGHRAADRTQPVALARPHRHEGGDGKAAFMECVSSLSCNNPGRWGVSFTLGSNGVNNCPKVTSRKTSKPRSAPGV